MAGRTFYVAVMIAAAVTVACAVALSAVSEKAEATFPGKNGRIAYSGYDGNDYEIYTMNPDGSNLKVTAPSGLSPAGGCDFIADDNPELTGLERLERDLAPVHKHCRSTLHAESIRALAVQENPLCDNFAGDISSILLHIESNFLGIVFEDRTRVESLVPTFLVFENHVVHFPKLTLETGRFRGACR